MNKSYFCQKNFLADWHYKRLKNTIDLLLFYWEHFYGFWESALQFQQKDKVLSYLGIKFSNGFIENEWMKIFFGNFHMPG